MWLLHVVPSLAEFHGVSENYFGPLSEAGLIALENERKSLVRDRLQRLACIQKQHFASAPSEICVKLAGVAESIVEYAGETHADLIMMPTRGLGPMRRFLIGSVAAKVLHDARAPIWTSPHPRELEAFHPYRRVVVAVDSLALPVDVLERGAAIAAAFGAQLSVLRALPPNGGHQNRVSGDEAVRTLSRAGGRELRDQLSKMNIKASVHVMEGSPGEVVRQVAEEIEEADLIVIGRGHLAESMGHLQTHAYEIICNAPCPVITL